eukprot:gene19416-6644_t
MFGSNDLASPDVFPGEVGEPYPVNFTVGNPGPHGRGSAAGGVKLTITITPGLVFEAVHFPWWCETTEAIFQSNQYICGVSMIAPNVTLHGSLVLFPQE